MQTEYPRKTTHPNIIFFSVPFFFPSIRIFFSSPSSLLLFLTLPPLPLLTPSFSFVFISFLFYICVFLIPCGLSVCVQSAHSILGPSEKEVLVLSCTRLVF
ncbi:hypothetical protein ASPBRDRAFT_251115 [Aspergillus brasiliensis CBS 101740]|uniref:Uncharacterized protein n=1 Tax=Aspergillus brasiliensis (strain CBS 101740 / IMI 381727 / IBT 21946) TaxID=767769 RepID=A0A1L9V1R9_ASPBC|nr:hypothetical protein ASPBRDRAFT_251115 [Aspergillus brasiliensis CBS 101740]